VAEKWRREIEIEEGKCLENRNRRHFVHFPHEIEIERKRNESHRKKKKRPPHWKEMFAIEERNQSIEIPERIDNRNTSHSSELQPLEKMFTSKSKWRAASTSMKQSKRKFSLHLDSPRISTPHFGVINREKIIYTHLRSSTGEIGRKSTPHIEIEALTGVCGLHREIGEGKSATSIRNQNQSIHTENTSIVHDICISEIGREWRNPQGRRNYGSEIDYNAGKLHDNQRKIEGDREINR